MNLDTPAANGQGAASVYPGGQATVFCRGTFDSGTVALQVSDDGVTFVAANDVLASAAEFSANGYADISFPPGVYLRTSLSGSSGSTSVTTKVLQNFTAKRQF